MFVLSQPRSPKKLHQIDQTWERKVGFEPWSLYLLQTHDTLFEIVTDHVGVQIEA